MQISESNTTALTMLEMARVAGKTIPRIKHVNIQSSPFELREKTILLSGKLVNGHHFESTCCLKKENGKWVADMIGLEVSAYKKSIFKADSKYHTVNAQFYQDGDRLVLTYDGIKEMVSVGTVQQGSSVIPKATESGLIPNGWTVEKDEVVSDFNICEVDWNFQACPLNLNWMTEAQVNKRLESVKSIGSLGFASVILKAQANGVFIIPWEATGYETLFPNTILVDPHGNRYMLQLSCCARWWEMEFKAIRTDFHHSNTFPILKSE